MKQFSAAMEEASDLYITERIDFILDSRSVLADDKDTRAYLRALTRKRNV